MTTKTELENLRDLINSKLTKLESPRRVELRGAYGKVGLDDVSGKNCNRNITPLMSRRELAAYMKAALDGLYMFS